MSLETSDPRLTAYAFGELEGEAKREFEAELANSAEARRELAEIERTILALENELSSTPSAALDQERRARIERAIDAPKPAGTSRKRKQRRWFVAVSSGLALAAGAMLFMTTGRKQEAVVARYLPVGSAVSHSASHVDQPPALLAGEQKSGGDGLLRARPDQGFGPLGAVGEPRDQQREQYDHVEDNPFVRVGTDPRSTFSIDVDTASYALVRRHLLDNGRLPPRGAVRIEELVNYFPYSYAEPAGAEPFRVQADVAAAPWRGEHRLLRIGLKGRHVAPEKIEGKNLVFLIDVSGSMDEPNKLPLLKRAFELLVGQLEARDRVAIVVYAGASGLVLPPTAGNDKQAIRAALDRLSAGGSTNGGDGIRLAYKKAAEGFIRGGVNRVILATDGDFNVGVTNTSELVDLVQDKARTGVYLSVLGFGQGNYNDAMLEKLADKGNGNYAYVDNFDEARKVLLEQATSTLVTIAKDVKIQIEFNPRKVEAFRLIGYENRVLAHQDFNDDRKDAGEIGSDHTVTALYEVVPAGQNVPGPSTDPLKYQKPGEASVSSNSDELATVKLRYKLPESERSELIEIAVRDGSGDIMQRSSDFRVAAAVAEFGMLLRGSPHKGLANYRQVIELASSAESDEYRREFLKLVRAAERLAPTEKP